jgi:hypothetical protein
LASLIDIVKPEKFIRAAALGPNVEIMGSERVVREILETFIRRAVDLQRNSS